MNGFNGKLTDVVSVSADITETELQQRMMLSIQG